MRHPSEGVLRRLLDEPAGVADVDRRHVADCPQCLGALAAVRRHPGAVRPGGASTPTAAGASTPTVAAASRTALRRPAVGILAVAVVLAGGATAAAQDWLPAFHTQQVAPVGLSATDLVALPDLRAYGDLALTGDPDVREVPDAAVAAAVTGLDVPRVSALPRGVSGEPAHLVGGEVTATFTFSADKAARAAADAGTALPPAPAGLDGSQVRLVAGPGAAQVWSRAEGVPSLVVGRAVAPTGFSSGVPFETARDYLLSLPGVPADVAERLRTFAADGSTLPLPVPADRVTTSGADVDGHPATVLATRDRSVAAVVWVDDGVVTAVAGSLGADEVLTIARELR